MKTFAAVVACALALGATGAQATDGQPLMIGQDNRATKMTKLTNTTEPALWLKSWSPNFTFAAETTQSQTAIWGRSENDHDDYASGVLGTMSYGSGAGVRGEAQPGDGTGVWGRSGTGTGVYAESGLGTALDVQGVTRFSRSGMVTLTKADTVTQGAELSADSYVLATLQTNVPDVWIRAAVPGTDSFTVYLNKKVKGPVKIAWFVIN